MLFVRVAAPPIDGAANKALIKFLAKVSGVAKSRILFISGENSRIKRLKLIGNGHAIAGKLTTAAKG